MMIRVVTGGQSGVDRGGWRAAVELGLDRGGYGPHDMRDEYGPIPAEVARDLERCKERGYPARTTANVALADVIVLVVQDARLPDATRGTALTRQLANRSPTIKPVQIADGSDLLWIEPWFRSWSESWAIERAADAVANLMIAGPRASLWTEGEEAARMVVHEIAKALRDQATEPTVH